MEHEFNENLSKIYQCLVKPFCELTELNISTLNNVIKNSNSFEGLLTTKNPEDILAAQVKLNNAAYLEATKYAQKVVEIGLNAASNAGKVWGESLNEATSKSFTFAKKSAGKGKEYAKEYTK